MASTKQKVAILLSEFLASYIVNFVGCVGQAMSSEILTTALSWGLAVLAATQIFRFISGAHINPCITIAAMIMEQVGMLDGLLFILMQFLGSMFGFFTAYGMLHRPYLAYYCPVVMADKWWKIMLRELFFTCYWVLAVLSSWHESNEQVLESISLRIGFIVVVCVLASGNTVGMNPFRSLMPMVFSKVKEEIGLYLFTPLLSALLITFAWRYLYARKGSEKKQQGVLE